MFHDPNPHDPLHRPRLRDVREEDQVEAFLRVCRFLGVSPAQVMSHDVTRNKVRYYLALDRAIHGGPVTARPSAPAGRPGRWENDPG